MTQSVTAYPGAGIDILRPKETPSFFQIDIPEELATLDGFFEAPAQQDPKLIFHIQNAHANYGAQEKIKQLLQYLDKTYAIKTIFVEGASEDLNPNYLKMFPDRERNLKLADLLAKQGELTGAELFVLEQGGESNTPVAAHGIENAELYRENYDALKKVFGAEVTVNRYLSRFEGRLEGLASKVFGADLRRLLGEWKKFEKGHREFMPYIRALVTEAKRILKIDLESLLAQVEWPQISRLLVLQTMEKDMNVEKGLAEKEQLVRFLKEKQVSSQLITAIEHFQDQRVNVSTGSSTQKGGAVQPRDLMEQLVTEAGPKGFKFYQYPNFSLYSGYLILKSELDPKALYEEIQTLFRSILDELAVTSSQKTLLELYRDEELIRKLLNLELTRKNWQEVLSKTDQLSMDSMVTRLRDVGTAVATEAHLPLTNFETKEVNPKFRTEVMAVQAAANVFYEAARQREEVFYEKIDAVMEKNGQRKAVLITGGFHTDGITDLLREHEISYGVLTPRLSEKSDEQLYRSVMLQDKSSLFELSYLEAAPKLISAQALKKQGVELVEDLKVALAAIRAVGELSLDDAIAIFNASVAASLYRLQIRKKEGEKDSYKIITTLKLKRNPLTHRVITFDGPSAVWKSESAEAVANEMGFLHVDTGSIYRSLTAKALEEGTNLDDAGEVDALINKTVIKLTKDPQGKLQVLVDGRAYSVKETRNAEVTKNVGLLARHLPVAEGIAQAVREVGETYDSVIEGRNIGTDIFPENDGKNVIKFYLTAEMAKRAERRHAEYQGLEDTRSVAEIQKELEKRDKSDNDRDVTPLWKPSDAVALDNSPFSFEQNVAEIMKVIRARSDVRSTSNVVDENTDPKIISEGRELRATSWSPIQKLLLAAAKAGLLTHLYIDIDNTLVTPQGFHNSEKQIAQMLRGILPYRKMQAAREVVFPRTGAEEFRAASNGFYRTAGGLDIKFLEELRKIGVRVVALTARPEAIKGQTMAMLSAVGLNGKFDAVVFAGSPGRQKAVSMEEDARESGVKDFRKVVYLDDQSKNTAVVNRVDKLIEGMSTVTSIHLDVPNANNENLSRAAYIASARTSAVEKKEGSVFENLVNAYDQSTEAEESEVLSLAGKWLSAAAAAQFSEWVAEMRAFLKENKIPKDALMAVQPDPSGLRKEFDSLMAKLREEVKLSSQEEVDLLQSFELAMAAHQAQKRKGSDRPYFVHQLEVASRLLERYRIADPTILALIVQIALFHDTREDQEGFYDQVRTILYDEVNTMFRGRDFVNLLRLGVKLLSKIEAQEVPGGWELRYRNEKGADVVRQFKTKEEADDAGQIQYLSQLVNVRKYFQKEQSGNPRYSAYTDAFIRAIQQIKLSDRNTNLNDMGSIFMGTNPVPEIYKSFPAKTFRKTLKFFIPGFIQAGQPGSPAAAQNPLVEDDRAEFLTTMLDTLRNYAELDLGQYPHAGPLKEAAQKMLRDLDQEPEYSKYGIIEKYASPSVRTLVQSFRADVRVASDSPEDIAKLAGVDSGREIYTGNPIETVVPQTANAKPLRLFMELSDDLTVMRYFDVATVSAPAGEFNEQTFVEAVRKQIREGKVQPFLTIDYKEDGPLKGQNLITPSPDSLSYLLSQVKNEKDRDLVEGLLTRDPAIWGSRYVSYAGIVTSWDVAIDSKAVWSMMIDTAHLIRVLREEVFSDPEVAANLSNAVEYGTGGGAVAAYIASQPNVREVVITDIVVKALSTAMKQLDKYKNPNARVRVYLGAGDTGVVGTVHADGTFDFVTSNPPYIPRMEGEKKVIEDTPYGGTSLVKAVLAAVPRQLNPKNPHAQMIMTLSSMTEVDLPGYVRDYGKQMIFEPIGERVRVPIKIGTSAPVGKSGKQVVEIGTMPTAWKDSFVRRGLLEHDSTRNDGERFFHYLQVFRARLAARQTDSKAIFAAFLERIQGLNKIRGPSAKLEAEMEIQMALDEVFRGAEQDKESFLKSFAFSGPYIFQIWHSAIADSFEQFSLSDQVKVLALAYRALSKMGIPADGSQVVSLNFRPLREFLKDTARRTSLTQALQQYDLNTLTEKSLAGAIDGLGVSFDPENSVLTVGARSDTRAELKGYSHKKGNWNEHVGRIWSDLLQKMEIDKRGVIVEIAPGDVSKVGLGLAFYGFEGTIYIVEPDFLALEKISAQYHSLMPKAKIVPIAKSLREAMQELPQSPDAVLANHPLDDMIVGNTLTAEEFQKFFDNHYEASPDVTREIWRTLGATAGRIERSKEEILGDFMRLMQSKLPKHMAISQYRSYFFTSNDISVPDDRAIELLGDISNSAGSLGYQASHPANDSIGNPEHWLLLEPTATKDLDKAPPSDQEVLSAGVVRSDLREEKQVVIEVRVDEMDSSNWRQVYEMLEKIRHNTETVIVLSGGAGKMSEASKQKLLRLFDALSILAQDYLITVGDGGTKAGIMEAAGEALHKSNGTYNLVGVTSAADTTATGEAGKTPLDPNHSLVITVKNPAWVEEQLKQGLQPGHGQWGVEVPTMYREIFERLTRNRSSVAIVANGGVVTLDEIRENLAQKRSMILIKGSDRAADVIVEIVEKVRRGEKVTAKDGTDEAANLWNKALKMGVAEHPELFEMFDMEDGPENLALFVQAFLRGRYAKQKYRKELNDEELDRLMSIVALEGYFQPLTKIRDKSKLLALFRKFLAKNGGFDIYEPGEVILGPYKGKYAGNDHRGDGRYHLMVSGEARLVSMQDFTEAYSGNDGVLVRDKDGNVIERLRRVRESPTFTRGDGFAAASVWDGRDHWGEIMATTSVQTFSLTREQFAELVSLVIEDQLEQGVPFVGELATEEMETLIKEDVFLEGYSDTEQLYRIRSPKEVKKTRAKASETNQKTFDGRLAQHEFVYRFTDSQGQVHWYVVNNEITEAIKNASSYQYVIQGDGTTQHVNLQKTNPVFMMPNTPFLIAAQSMSGVPRPQIAEGQQIVEYQGAMAPPYDVYVADKVKVPLMKDGQPVLNEKGKQVMTDAPGSEQATARLTVTDASGNTLTLEPVSVAQDGVIDPVAILNKAYPQGAHGVKITGITISVPSVWKLHRLDVASYMSRLEGAAGYSIDDLINEVQNQGYQFSESDRVRLKSLLRDGIRRHEESSGVRYSDLPQNFRRKLFELVMRWVIYDKLPRIGTDSVPIDLDEIEILMDQYIETQGEKEGLPDYRDVQAGLELRFKDRFGSKFGEKYTETIQKKTRRVWNILRANDPSGDWQAEKLHTILKTIEAGKRETIVDSFAVSRVDLKVSPDAAQGMDNVFIVPDIHEGLQELLDWALASGLADGKGDLMDRPGAKLIALGDMINRYVGPDGTAVMELLKKWHRQALAFNREHRYEGADQMQVQITLGNHELDLLRWSIQDAQRNAEGLGFNVNDVRARLFEMIEDGLLVVGVFDGVDPLKGALYCHAGLFPSVRDRVLKVMAQRIEKGEINATDYPLNMQGVVLYMNRLLRESIPAREGGQAFKGTERCDFGREETGGFIFDKSKRRNYSGIGPEQSGVIEGDVGPWEGNDLFFELVMLGIFKPEFRSMTKQELWAALKGKTVSDILADNMTLEAAQEIVAREFGVQIVGHSFSSDDVQQVRPMAMMGLSFPNIIITDAGRRQSQDPFPENRSTGLVFRKGVLYKVNALKRPLNPEEMLDTEAVGLRMLNEKIWTGEVSTTAGIVRTIAEPSRVTGFADTNISEIGVETDVYEALQKALAPDTFKSRIPSRDLQILAKAGAVQEVYGKILIEQGHYVVGLSGEFSISLNGQDTVQQGPVLLASPQNLKEVPIVSLKGNGAVLTVSASDPALVNNPSVAYSLDHFVPKVSFSASPVSVDSGTKARSDVRENVIDKFVAAGMRNGKYDPAVAIEWLKNSDPSGVLKKQFEARKYGWEGGTLQEHALGVARNFEINLDRVLAALSPAAREPFKSHIDMIRLLIAVHDIGEPTSHAQQHEETEAIINEFAGRWELTAEQKTFMLALLFGEPGKKFLSSRFHTGVDEAKVWRENAMKAGIPEAVFYAAQLAFWMADSVVYAVSRVSGFQMKDDGYIYKRDIPKLVQLLEVLEAHSDGQFKPTTLLAEDSSDVPGVMPAVVRDFRFEARGEEGHLSGMSYLYGLEMKSVAEAHEFMEFNKYTTLIGIDAVGITAGQAADLERQINAQPVSDGTLFVIRADHAPLLKRLNGIAHARGFGVMALVPLSLFDPALGNELPVSDYWMIDNENNMERLASSLSAISSGENFVARSELRPEEAVFKEDLERIRVAAPSFGKTYKGFSRENLMRKLQALFDRGGPSDRILRDYLMKAVNRVAFLTETGVEKDNLSKVLGISGDVSALYEVVVNRGGILRSLEPGRIIAVNPYVYDKRKEVDGWLSGTIIEAKFDGGNWDIATQGLGGDRYHMSHLEAIVRDPALGDIRNMLFFAENDGDDYLVEAALAYLRQGGRIKELIVTDKGFSMKLELRDMPGYFFNPNVLQVLHRERSGMRGPHWVEMKSEMSGWINAKYKQMRPGEHFDVIIAVSNTDRSRIADLQRFTRRTASETGKRSEVRPTESVEAMASTLRARNVESKVPQVGLDYLRQTKLSEVGLANADKDVDAALRIALLVHGILALDARDSVKAAGQLTALAGALGLAAMEEVLAALPSGHVMPVNGEPGHVVLFVSSPEEATRLLRVVQIMLALNPALKYTFVLAAGVNDELVVKDLSKRFSTWAEGLPRKGIRLSGLAGRFESYTEAKFMKRVAPGLQANSLLAVADRTKFRGVDFSRLGSRSVIANLAYTANDQADPAAHSGLVKASQAIAKSGTKQLADLEPSIPGIFESLSEFEYDPQIRKVSITNKSLSAAIARVWQEFRALMQTAISA